ncbi:MAG: hypothetical protein GY851_36475 [bacterium]|nr:hypothetical protein [bacterium]
MTGVKRSHPAGEVATFVAAAFACRLGFMLVLDRVVDSADAIHYVEQARQFASGQFFDMSQRIPPLYPALCALCHLVIDDFELAARVVSLMASSLLIVPVYMLSSDMHGRRSARIAALIVCLFPWLVDYGSRVMPEAVASLMWFLSVWTLARALRRGGPWLIAAPLAFFGLHLARPEGLLLLLAAPVAGLVLCAGSKDAPFRRLGVFVAVSMGLLGLFAAFMYRAIGVATVSYRLTSVGGAVQHALVARARELYRSVEGTLFRDIPIMTGPYLMPLMGVGLFAIEDGEQRRDIRLELAVLFFAAVQTGAAILSTMAEPRYIMSVVIALSLWAAHGMATVSARAAKSPTWRRLRLAPVAGFVALAALGAAMTVVPGMLGGIGYMPREHKTAGEWMKDNVEPGLIFTRKPWVGFYADMPSTGPAAVENLEQSIQRARNAEARYVVVDERYTTKMIPAWEPLLDPTQAPDDLRLLKADLSPFGEARIVVYELVGDGAPEGQDGDAER